MDSFSLLVFQDVDTIRNVFHNTGMFFNYPLAIIHYILSSSPRVAHFLELKQTYVPSTTGAFLGSFIIWTLVAGMHASDQRHYRWEKEKKEWGKERS